MPKIRTENPGQVRVRIKWYVSRQSNFLALILTNSNCPARTRMWRDLLLITNHASMLIFRQGHTQGEAGISLDRARSLVSDPHTLCHTCPAVAGLARPLQIGRPCRF